MTKTFGLMLASALFAASLYAQDGYYEEEPAAVQKEVQREASQPADVQQAATAAATEASAPAASNEGPKSPRHLAFPHRKSPHWPPILHLNRTEL